MKKELTELVFILDRSGSMAGLEEDTVGGFNAMIAKQKKVPGEAVVSTVLFDHEQIVIHDRADIRLVEPMTLEQFEVRGSTALMDAIGKAIHHIGNVHRYAREEDRPGHTLFVIITDGMENASHVYTPREIREKILRQKSRYGWEFLFLGANMDAVDAADEIGIGCDRSVTYRADAKGTCLNYEVLNDAVCRTRLNEVLPPDWAEPIRRDMNERRG